MKAENHKNLILSLIKDDLINSKLIDALNDAGLNAHGYYLQLSTTIFGLMGYKENNYSNEIFEQYRNLVATVKHVNINEEGYCSVKLLVLKLYDLLVENAPR